MISYTCYSLLDQIQCYKPYFTNMLFYPQLNLSGNIGYDKTNFTLLSGMVLMFTIQFSNK